MSSVGVRVDSEIIKKILHPDIDPQSDNLGLNFVGNCGPARRGTDLEVHNLYQEVGDDISVDSLRSFFTIC